MEVQTAVFVKSAADYRDCPASDIPEFAFIGRSNVGKSSLINALTRQKKLAKISSTPGKTRLINHFLINNTWYLVDLPGYGYARASKRTREALQPMITRYLLQRTNLRCTFILVDARHEPQANDLEFMEWMAENKLPFVILFTKADKLGQTGLLESLATYKTVLEESWDELPVSVVTSAVSGKGKHDLLALIGQICEETSSIA